MQVIFSPVSAFNELIRLDRKVALPLVAGLAVIAAAAIAKTWQVDVPTVGLMGGYIAILGAALILFANWLNDPMTKRVLGWFLTILLIASIAAFFISAVFRNQGLIKPTYCLVRFWEHCVEVEAAVVQRNAETIEAQTEVAAPPPPTGQPAPAGYRVFIHFAGLITPESVASLNQSFREQGWGMQGDSGERLIAAQGFNEVRYSREQDRQAAERLAEALTATRISSGPVQVRQMNMIRPATLEVWISN